MGRSDCVVGFLIVTAILVGAAGIGYFSLISMKERTEQIKVIQAEKTHRTEERSRILKDIIPWAKKKD